MLDIERGVRLLKRIMVTLTLNHEILKPTSTLFKVSFFLVHLFYSSPFSFFLVHLFYSSSFGLLNSIKGMGNSTIIQLTYFSEFDVYFYMLKIDSIR